MTGSARSSILLARRFFAHRRALTLLIILVSAAICGTVVFGSGYQRQAQQAVLDGTFAADGTGITWHLTGPPGTDLAGLLPPGLRRLTEAPVDGRSAQVTWSSPHGGLQVTGLKLWRDDVCAHLILVAGQCPSTEGQVAVSADDAAGFGVRSGDPLVQRATIGVTTDLIVSGVYRTRDRDEPYWFGNPPTGRSRVDPARQIGLGDPLITARDQFDDTTHFDTLDVRVAGAGLRLDDLPELDATTRALAAAATAHQTSVTTGVPASLERVAQERARAVSGLALTFAQLGALIGVVLALLASVALSGYRGELGLGRLRGERRRDLFRLALVRWTAVVVLGWLLGVVPGVALLVVSARQLPGTHGLPEGVALLVAPLVALAILVAIMVPATRSMLALPVLSVLRAAPAAARETGVRQQVVDGLMIILAVCGLLVALQAGTSSVLGLLVPSLLAIGLSVLLVRGLVRLAAAVRQRSSRSGGRPATTLTAILIVRLGGLRVLVAATSLAAAFAVFAVQVQVIGDGVRRHVAEVSTGAAAVLEVGAGPTAVLEALDQLDPQHRTSAATMTAVVLTRRDDPTALRGMFVEPEGFARVALGVERAAATSQWRAVAAPDIPPIVFTGTAATIAVGAHDYLGRSSSEPPNEGVDPVVRTGTRATLGIDYLGADGVAHSQDLGQLQLSGGGGAQRFSRPVDCGAGCRLLRIRLAPNGPMAGVVPVTSFSTDGEVVLGAADQWQPVPSADPHTQVGSEPVARGLSLAVKSEGAPLAVQYAWAPVVLPVVLAREVRLGAQPSLAAPDGSQLPILEQGRAADAIPGQLTGVAVADLQSGLRVGFRSLPTGTRVQIWVSSAAMGRLPELTSALAARGVPVVRVQTLADATSAQRTTALALTGRIAPALALLAGLFAALGIALMVAGHRGVLGHDLAALRLAGVRPSALRRAAAAAYLVPGVPAVLVGAAAGAVGCALVIGDLPLLPSASTAIRNDLGLRLGPLLGCVGGALVVLVSTVLLSVSWLSRGSDVDRLGGPR